MKVIAIKPAFFNGQRIRVGAELEVPDNLKASWFVKSDNAKPKAEKAKKDEPKALSELGGASGKSFNDVHSDTLA